MAEDEVCVDRAVVTASIMHTHARAQFPFCLRGNSCAAFVAVSMKGVFVLLRYVLRILRSLLSSEMQMQNPAFLLLRVFFCGKRTTYF